MGYFLILLLDTHVWIWWINQTPNKIPAKVIRQIEQSEIVSISAISCFEVIWLSNHQRISFNIPVCEWVIQATEGACITCVPVTLEIACLAANLPEHHKDPQDRIIIATAISQRYRLVSADLQFPAYREINDLLIPI